MNGDPAGEGDEGPGAWRHEELVAAGKRDREERLRRFEAVSDELLLAALDRAERHWAHYSAGQRGVALSQIKAHLGFAHTAATTRGLRPQLDALIERGAIRPFSRHGHAQLELTQVGHRQLARARRHGAISLPEAPQHYQWRLARERAPMLLDESRQALRARLAEAVALLNAEDTRADDWLDLQKRVDWECRRAASAIFCLREWPEPEDAQLDNQRRWELSDSAVLRLRD